MPCTPHLERSEEALETGPGIDLRKERGDWHGVPIGRHTMSHAEGATGTPLPRGGSIDRWSGLRARSCGVQVPAFCFGLCSFFH